MHSGFRALRQNMWMNLGRDYSGLGRTPDTLADIARIEAAWAGARQVSGGTGPYLFGAMLTVADIMYAPVVTRFLTWRPAISTATQSYVDAVRAHKLVAEWYDGAAQEPADWLVDDYEKTPHN
jgi:glutathione S-transferase